MVRRLPTFRGAIKQPLYGHFQPESIPTALCPFSETLPAPGENDQTKIPEGRRPKIKRGQHLGRVGSTGNSGNPHLHIQMGRDGDKPLRFHGTSVKGRPSARSQRRFPPPGRMIKPRYPKAAGPRSTTIPMRLRTGLASRARSCRPARSPYCRTRRKCRKEVPAIQSNLRLGVAPIYEAHHNPVNCDRVSRWVSLASPHSATSPGVASNQTSAGRSLPDLTPRRARWASL